MAQERLQKIIAAAGLASRRQAEKWIEQGRVSVNGNPANLGEKADPAVDNILVDDVAIGRPEKKTYILLNKPVGYVTTMRDPEGRRVVTDLLEGVSERVVPVGRLDLTTEGLLLLTNDGDLAQKLSHPRFHVEKTYLARVRGMIDNNALRKLERGVELDDGLTAPARAECTRKTGSHSWLKITIHEGRNRQVRRMCEALGFSVSRLKRIGYAFLLEENLGSGDFRHLEPGEIAKLKHLADGRS
ncbi:MAG: pseudouridine synthase [Desulfuromonas sp.]|nr:MAG: pseudouridine synthase [Desulfuromonas sp.]